MKGDKKIIDYLNKALANELAGINQYFLHSRMLEIRGVKQLAQSFYQSALQEMKHADLLIQRILFLEGSPSLVNNYELNIGDNAEAMLKSDLDLEKKAVKLLIEAVAYSSSDKALDPVSADLFTDLLNAEEKHIEWLSSQLHIIETIGLPAYLQSKL